MYKLFVKSYKDIEYHLKRQPIWLSKHDFYELGYTTTLQTNDVLVKPTSHAC